mgnify:FL=1
MGKPRYGKNNPAWKGGKQKQTCNWCNSTYFVHPCEINRTKYCSRSCRAKALFTKPKRKITCLTCKIEITLKRNRPERDIIKYCSRQCFSKDRIGKTLKNKGRPLSPEHRAKLSGENANNWQGGISSKNEIERHRIEYRLWRSAVFARDNYTCVMCHVRGSGNLEADHIKPFAYYPELRLAIDNGRTLCVDCHKQTDTWGGRAFKYGTSKVII